MGRPREVRMRATWMSNDKPCTPEELQAEGIHHEQLDLADLPSALERVKHRYDVPKDEEIELTTENPKHEAAIAKEEDEHAHMADEVRVVLEGDVVYEVRASDDRWIRIATGAGALVVVPAKRY